MIKWNVEALLNEVHKKTLVMPSETDIANGSGVSRATVRRILGKDRGVPDKANLEILGGLCVYFTEKLERKVGVGEILLWIEEQSDASRHETLPA